MKSKIFLAGLIFAFFANAEAKKKPIEESVSGCPLEAGGGPVPAMAWAGEGMSVLVCSDRENEGGDADLNQIELRNFRIYYGRRGNETESLFASTNGEELYRLERAKQGLVVTELLDLNGVAQPFVRFQVDCDRAGCHRTNKKCVLKRVRIKSAKEDEKSKKSPTGEFEQAPMDAQVSQLFERAIQGDKAAYQEFSEVSETDQKAVENYPKYKRALERAKQFSCF